MRRSEYLECDGKLSCYIITKADVIFEDKTGRKTTTKDDVEAVVIHFRGSKTDQEGLGSIRRLQKSGDSVLCPVRAAWALWKHAQVDDEPLCSPHAGLCLSSRAMSRAIKKGAAALGLDPTHFGTHSLRSGGATALFEAGISDTAIKQQGRWRSNCFQMYTRIEETTGARLAKEMARQC